jgi:hypothetical protein
VNGFCFNYRWGLGKFQNHSLDLLTSKGHFNELANLVDILLIRRDMVIKNPFNVGDVYGDAGVE